MRFRFTIRDLLWLTALVALGFGWWLDHRRLTVVPFPNNLSLIIGGGQEVHEEAADLSAEEYSKLEADAERAKNAKQPER